MATWSDTPAHWSQVELPVAGQDPAPAAERADAVRNRQRVLAATADLLAHGEPAGLTMDAIARAAGVGRATLYRRFPDVASVARALLHEHERELQDRILRGEPPLGPGAPAADRLAAFYAAMVQVLEQHAHLALAAEVGRSRFTPGAYEFWSTHVLVLLIEARTPDPRAMVDILLAPLAPEVYLHQRRDLRHSPDQIAAGLARLAHGIAGSRDSHTASPATAQRHAEP